MLTNFITTDIVLIIVLTFALIAIALEIMIPSFGIIGIIGIYLLIESILAIQHFANPYMAIFISIIIAAIVTFIMSRYLLRNIDNNRLVLQSNLSKAKGNRKRNYEESLIGKTGVVVKVLRPSGEVEIEGLVYDAISEGDFIERGSMVIVDQVRGSQLVCRKLN